MLYGTFWLAAKFMFWLMTLAESGKKFVCEFEATFKDWPACDAIEFIIAG